MESDSELRARIRGAVLQGLLMTDIKPEEIEDEAPLFGEEGLGFDSVDALEVAFIIEDTFGVRLPEGESERAVFTSIRTLGDYVIAHRPPPGGADPS